MPHLRRGHVEMVVFIVVVVLGWAEVSAPPPIVIKDNAACGAGGTHCNDDKEVGERAMAGAGNSGKSRGSVRADVNQP